MPQKPSRGGLLGDLFHLLASPPTCGLVRLKEEVE